MAFASVGTLGSALSSGNNQSTLVLTTSAAAEVGNLVVVAIAVDNRTGTGGASTDVSGVSDNSTSGPNNWQRAVGFTNTNGGAAQDGADISIWYAKITTQINNGGTITATFTSATTSDATAMSAWEFTVTGGVAVENTNTLANDAAAAGSLDATTTNIECLRFRATASESNSSTVWTKTAAFDSLITQAVSGAGTSATEMGVRGEFDISTGTGSASAPTGGAGAVDNASAYVAFKETIAHVAEMGLAGAGSFSAETDKKPSEATFAGNGAICPSSFTALLHFDGADTSQTITDAVGHTWTAVNDAQLDDAQQKFGATSVFFDGATDYILGDGSQDFAFDTGDFTIDFWYRPDTLAETHSLFDWRSTNQTSNFQLEVGTNGSVSLFQDGFWINAPAGTIVVDTWQHIALVRVSNVHTLYVNGIAAGGTHTTSQSYGIEANRPVIGAVYLSLGSSSVHGWIDEFAVRRFAVWTSNFTPPSSAYVFDGGLIVTQNMAAQEWLGGTGSFSADATVTSAGGTAHVGETRFAGAGNFSVDVQNTKQGETRFAGVGNLSAQPQLNEVGFATFQGVGNLSVNIQNTKQGAATFAGVDSFSTNVTARFATAATYAGLGSISINTLLIAQALATFAGVGSFSVNATAAGTQAGEARFAGAGSLSVNATVKLAGAAMLAGSGSLSAVLRQTMAAQTTLQGAGSFSPLVSQAWAVGAIFAGAGNASFHVMQLKPLIPDGDSSTGGWLNEVDSLPLFPSLDEIVPLDVDYIKSSAAPTVDICKVSLSNPTTATLVAPVSVLYRYGKSGTDPAYLQVRLLQGTTMIAVWQHDDIASGFVTVEQVLTDGMITNITDWNDLFLEFRSGTITAHMGRANFSGSGVM